MPDMSGLRMVVHRVIVALSFCLLVGQVAEAADSMLDKARRITGYLPLKTSNDDTPRWSSLDERHSTYSGPVRCAPGKWFRAEPGRPQMIATQEDLERWVSAMAYNLQEKDTLKLAPCVTLDSVRQWVRKINTSLYGLISVESRNGECTLKVAYTPEARILAAFRNDAMRKVLEKKERAVLEMCAWWISGNISIGMPNCQKLQKVHDVIIDTSVYCPKKHDTLAMLQEGQGSCVTYSRTAQLLLHMLKIDCRMVFGTPEMNHVWNMVEIDDEWYHLDISWDDPVAAAPLRTYNYYLLTDVEIASDHDWVNPELYPETPQVNSRHFHMRHHTKHGCVAAASGYTLPREDEHIAPSLYNTYAKSVGGRADMVAQMLGVELNRDKEIEKAYLLDAKRDPVKDVRNPTRLVFDKARVTRLVGRMPAKPGKVNAAEQKIRNFREFNKMLEDYVSCLAGPRLHFQCAEEVEDWRMREIVGLSDINEYAEKFNVVYDAEQKSISIDIRYWEHQLFLAALRNRSLASKLDAAQQALLARLAKRAASLSRIPSNEKKIACVMGHCPKGLKARVITNPLKQAEQGVRYYNSFGRAQLAYVLLNACDVPTRMVFGRVECREETWVLSQLNAKDWLHSVYYPTCAGKLVNPCCYQIKGMYLYLCDDQIRVDHIWNPEGLPPTPSSDELEARQKLFEELRSSVCES